MIFPIGATRRTQHHTAANTIYDAVVVGGGISGAIIADELSRAGKRVLVLEAGPAEDHHSKGYEGYLERFYARRQQGQPVALPGQPQRADAAQHRRPTESARASRTAAATSSRTGPFATDTTYTRVLGGTTMHWEAKTLRMLPEDFEMRTPLRRGPRTGRSATRN